jgi:drug/metabolite transporter (DMT)-like permease
MHLIYAAMVASVLMDIAIKMVSPEVSTWTLVAWRWTIAVLILGPVVAIRFESSDWRPLDRIHAWRTALNGVGVFCLFHSLQHLQLSVVVTIFFAEPLFTTLFASVVGKEKVGGADWVVSIVGFLGVALVVLGAGQPVGGLMDWVDVDALIALLGAASFGLTSVVTRRFGMGHSSLALAFWMAVSSAIVGATMAGQALLEVKPTDFLLICVAAALGTVFALLWVSGLKRMSASTAASARYLTLPLSYLLGYVFFSEIPTPTAVVGSGVLLLVVGVFMRPGIRNRIDAAFGAAK